MDWTAEGIRGMMRERCGGGDIHVDRLGRNVWRAMCVGTTMRGDEPLIKARAQSASANISSALTYI